MLGNHVPAGDPRNPDTAALGALEQALFGETSPLYQELVLKEQKVATLSASAGPRRDPGLFMIMARLRKLEDLATVRERIVAALGEAAKRPIESSRLSEIKSHLRYEFASSLSTADAVANTLGAAVAITGRPGSINELYEAYDRLTPADLQRVAARYFQAANETAITLQTEKTK
jgi:zinc protease